MRRLLIAVDAGHGGQDPGASGNGLTEAEVVADLANVRFAHIARATGHQVVLTRPLGYVSLADRAWRAKDARAELFLSWHCNSASSLARGLQVWYHGDQRSKKIAQRLHALATNALPMWAGNASRIAADTERYRTGFAVLRGTYQKMPALLLEVGFLSNEEDANLLRNPLVKQATVMLVMAGLIAAQAHDEL